MCVRGRLDHRGINCPLPPPSSVSGPPARLSRLKLFNRDWIFRVPGAEIIHIQKFTTSQVDTLSYPRSAGGGAGAQGGTGDKYLYQMSCTLCAIGVCVCVCHHIWRIKAEKRQRSSLLFRGTEFIQLLAALSIFSTRIIWRKGWILLLLWKMDDHPVGLQHTIPPPFPNGCSPKNFSSNNPCCSNAAKWLVGHSTTSPN